MNLLEGKRKPKTAALLKLKHVVEKRETEEVEKMGRRVGRGGRHWTATEECRGALMRHLVGLFSPSKWSLHSATLPSWMEVPEHQFNLLQDVFIAHETRVQSWAWHHGEHKISTYYTNPHSIKEHADLMRGGKMVAIYEDAGERSKYNIKQNVHWKHRNGWNK